MGYETQQSYTVLAYPFCGIFLLLARARCVRRTHPTQEATDGRRQAGRQEEQMEENEKTLIQLVFSSSVDK